MFAAHSHDNTIYTLHIQLAERFKRDHSVTELPSIHENHQTHKLGSLILEYLVRLTVSPGGKTTNKQN